MESSETNIQSAKHDDIHEPMLRKHSSSVAVSSELEEILSNPSLSNFQRFRSATWLELNISFLLYILLFLLLDGDITDSPPPVAFRKDSDHNFTVPFMQKLIAEVAGTYFLILAGCGSVVANFDNEKVVTQPGISIVWGLAVMVLVYSVGHISGAHFNPAVTIAFASCKRFPLKQVPAYIAAQVLGSTLAAGTLRLLFTGQHDVFAGTSPQGSDLQAFVIEFIITFYLMFIISGVATDNRAIRELAGLAVGSTVLLNVMFAGPITGASMNPARSLGPAIVSNHWRGIWIYLISPTLGAVSGAWAYNMVR